MLNDGNHVTIFISIPIFNPLGSCIILNTNIYILYQCHATLRLAMGFKEMYFQILSFHMYWSLIHSKPFIQTQDCLKALQTFTKGWRYGSSRTPYLPCKNEALSTNPGTTHTRPTKKQRKTKTKQNKTTKKTLIKPKKNIDVRRWGAEWLSNVANPFTCEVISTKLKGDLIKLGDY
jgi:hypothetical protein